MRQKTKNHRNQGSFDKKFDFFLQTLSHIARWVRFVQKTRAKNSHAWAPLKKLFHLSVKLRFMPQERRNTKRLERHVTSLAGCQMEQLAKKWHQGVWTVDFATAALQNGFAKRNKGVIKWSCTTTALRWTMKVIKNFMFFVIFRIILFFIWGESTWKNIIRFVTFACQDPALSSSTVSFIPRRLQRLNLRFHWTS